MRRGQRRFLFCLIFFGAVGIFQVDQAYSDMMDTAGVISVSVCRVDEENIRIGCFGKSREWNTTDAEEAVFQAYGKAKRSLTAALYFFAGKDVEEPDVKQAVFPVQTL